MSDETARAGARAQGSASIPKVRAALLRYRVLAWITGFGLILLTYSLLRHVGLALPGAEGISEWLGPIHGTFYILLLVSTFDLGTRVRWSWSRMILTALAGTVPFLSFYAERRNTAAVVRLLQRG
ncbi:DUF3817 domain-containing protein [Kineococcus gynurae]|uniref:DUF3817 domain-containing protein n=1 Tax=Kineococcus gynurae TaxID=452979 RepID=A0ABV5LT88_9ACTN